LQAAIAERSFREDLYYRLAAMTIRVPPLRERREDIPSLATLFLERAAERLRKRIQGIEPEALELLTEAGWPGNVRHLQNEMERAVALARDGDTISLRHLSPELISSTIGRAAAAPAANGASVTPVSPASAKSASLAQAIAAFERKFIAERLLQNNHNVSRTAASLRISRITLQKKMKEYSLRGP
jgi:transcriptional regulator with PAS, ATPase and Fis domain